MFSIRTTEEELEKSGGVQGSLVSGVLLARSHDAMPRHMNIYERKLLQLRRFISSGTSYGAAQEAIVSHAVLDVSGFQPNMADCLSSPNLSGLIVLSVYEAPGE